MRAAAVFWVLAGTASAAFFVATYQQARPEAALTLKVGRNEALAQSRAFVEGQGTQLDGYREAIAFYTDPQTKSFLEKEASADANRLMAEEVIPWYWYVRFFVPLQEEEHAVALAPDGRLLFYYHFLPEDAPAPRTTREVGQAAAEAFVAAHMNRDLAAFRLVESSEESLPARREYSFTWEKTDFEVAGAKLRIDAVATGGAVTYAEEYLHIPQVWTRAQDKQYALREFLTSVARYGQYGLHLAALVLLYLFLRAGKLHFRPVLGLAGLMLLIPMLEALNALPSAWLYYDTADTVLAHYGAQLLGVVEHMVGGPMTVLIVAAPAITLARQVLPGHPPVDELFSRRFWSSRGVFAACGVGVALGAVHCAFYNLFYLVGAPFGVWSPQATPFLDALGMPMPWIEPLSIGFMAAVDEELVFRLFAIVLLLRLTRSRLLALLLPALVWGFLHSTYPQEPAYIRGLELTLVGVLYGMVFLRYGVLATFLSHFAYNAIAAAVFLLQSGDAYAMWSGGIVVGLTVVPLVPGLRRLAQRRPLYEYAEVEAESANASYEQPAPRASNVGGEEAPAYVPMPSARLLGLGLLAAVLLLFALVPRAPHFGDHVRVTADRHQAREAADAWLAARGVDPAQYQSYAHFQNNLDGNEADYIWQQAGVEGLRRITKRRFADRPGWQVRYFRPMEEEAYGIHLDAGGSVRYHYHWLPETAPGDTLSQEEARALAEQHLAESWGVDLGRHELVYAHSSEKDARTDHNFTWEDQGGRVGAATFRHRVSVLGSEPMGGAPYLEVPESWLRARAEMRMRDLVLTVLMLLTGSVVAMFLMLLAYRLIKLHLLQFRCAAVLALIAPVGSVLSHANAMPLFWAGYDRATDPGLFAIRKGLAWFLAEPVGAYLGAVLLIAFADAAYRHVFPLRYTLAQCFAIGGEQMRNRRQLWGEALLIACCLSLAVFGMECAFQSVHLEEDLAEWSVEVHESAPGARYAAGQAGWAPLLGILAQRAQDVQPGFAFLIGVLVLHRYLWSWKRLVSLCAPFAAAGAMLDASTLGAGVGAFVGALLFFLAASAGAVFLARWILFDNLPALLATAFLLSLPREIEQLLNAPRVSAGADAAVLIGVFTAVLAIGAWLRFGQGIASGPPDDSVG